MAKWEVKNIFAMSIIHNFQKKSRAKHSLLENNEDKFNPLYCSFLESPISANNHQQNSSFTLLRFGIDRLIYSTNYLLEDIKNFFLKDFGKQPNRTIKLFSKYNKHKSIGFNYQYLIPDGHNSLRLIEVLDYNMAKNKIILIRLNNPSKKLMTYFSNPHYKISKCELAYDYQVDNLDLSLLEQIHKKTILNIKGYNDKNKSYFYDGRSEFDIFYDKKSPNYLKINQEKLFKHSYYCGLFNKKSNRVQIHKGKYCSRIYVKNLFKRNKYYISKRGWKIKLPDIVGGIVRYEIQLNREYIRQNNFKLPIRKWPSIFEFIKLIGD